MGDACNEAEVEAFMREERIQKLFAEYRKLIRGRWIADVSFHVSADGVLMKMDFHNGEPLWFLMLDLTLDKIQQYQERQSMALDAVGFSSPV